MLVEIPISGVAGAVLGTLLAPLGKGARVLTDLAARAPGPCVLELDAIDLCDAGDVDDALVHMQPALRMARDAKTRAADDAIATLQTARTLATLADVERALTAHSS